MSKTTVTAEEFLLKDEDYKELHLDYPKLSKAIQEAMIEFAKIKVKEALEAAADNVRYKLIDSVAELDPTFDNYIEIDKQSILTAYDIEGIK